MVGHRPVARRAGRPPFPDKNRGQSRLSICGTKARNRTPPDLRRRIDDSRALTDESPHLTCVPSRLTPEPLRLMAERRGLKRERPVLGHDALNVNVEARLLKREAPGLLFEGTCLTNE